MNSVTTNLGVYRMLLGHTQGVAAAKTDLREQAAKQDISPTRQAGQSKGMAFALEREQALNGVATGAQPFDLQSKSQGKAGERDITSSCAGSLEQSRYLQGLMSGNVEGPIPMSELIARQNYENAKKLQGS